MQENNFEEQVQQKMEELKLIPSEGVWQKVAVAVAKRKNDRRVFALIFLLLLLIGSAIFMWGPGSGKMTGTAFSEKNNPVKSNSVLEQSPEKQTRQIAGAENKPVTDSKVLTGGKINVSKDAKAVKNFTRPGKAAPIPLPEKLIDQAAGNKPVNHNSDIADRNHTKVDEHNKTSPGNYKTREKFSVSVSSGNPADSVNEMNGSNDTGAIKIGEVSPVINGAVINERIADTVSNDLIDIKNKVKDTTRGIFEMAHQKTGTEKNSLQPKQKNKWQIGLTLSFGVAATRNGYLGIIGPGSDAESKAFDSYPNQANGGGPGSNTSYLPSKIKSGSGLTLGVFVQRNISPKTNFLIGLNYKTYGSSMVIGSRVDSTSNFSFNTLSSFFYRSGNSYRYKNHFHFIELPVAVRFKLGRQNKVPVYLNTGISISRLISTNALQFEPGPGAYYSDKTLFNKTLVNVSGGLLFSLSGMAKNPFLIGPDINFSINKMANAGLYKDRHYSYFGILLQKGIGKK